MLCSDFKEKEILTINVENKRFEHMVMLLAWIDPAVAFNLNVNEAETLLPLADEYDITSLRQSCLNILINNLPMGSSEVVFRYLNIGEQGNMTALIEAAISRATEFNPSDLKSDENLYNSISPSTLTKILEKRIIKCEKSIESTPPRRGAKSQRHLATQSTITTQAASGFSFCAAVPSTFQEPTKPTQAAFGSSFPLGGAFLTTLQGPTNPTLVSDTETMVSTTQKQLEECTVDSIYCSSSDLTDVTIVVEEKKLYFYSEVLRRTSSVFSSKLDTIDEDREISLDVGTFQDLSVLLEYLDPRTKRILPSVKTALQLLWLSLEYDIQILHEACENYLTSNISKGDEHDVTRCILLADRGQCSELKTVGKREATRIRIDKLKQTESYKEFDPVTRIELLEYKLRY
ncbi:uncharacterized protein LOC121379976 [Gigantopelta aegis]|uniref:uncharacterized protein LOC121379976 n=1 Tax=Gigantopelta aegis TaxID=1735272 RepID=UPI001B88C29D|nr:uncharacterized protein LOC121379976 [Gigantopelta aegis]